jgi:hypothetical protein
MLMISGGLEESAGYPLFLAQEFHGWIGRVGGDRNYPFQRSQGLAKHFAEQKGTNLAAWGTLIAALKLPRFFHPALRIGNNISTTLPWATRIACGTACV